MGWNIDIKVSCYRTFATHNSNWIHMFCICYFWRIGQRHILAYTYLLFSFPKKIFFIFKGLSVCSISTVYLFAFCLLTINKGFFCNNVSQNNLSSPVLLLLSWPNLHTMFSLCGKKSPSVGGWEINSSLLVEECIQRFDRSQNWGFTVKWNVSPQPLKSF